MSVFLNFNYYITFSHIEYFSVLNYICCTIISGKNKAVLFTLLKLKYFDTFQNQSSLFFVYILLFMLCMVSPVGSLTLIVVLNFIISIMFFVS